MFLANSPSLQSVPLPDPKFAEPTPFSVAVSPVVRKNWFSIQRVRVGAEPHRVRLSRPWHTLLIYEQGSFVAGERRIDELRIGTPGPLDIGIDVIPAHSLFEANARQGSQVTCSVVSLPEQITQEFFGDKAAKRPLKAAFNVGGNLLLLLGARLRELCSKDPESIDALHVESLLSLLFREIYTAQEGSDSVASQGFTGGLSARAQRVLQTFLRENLDQKIDLDTLAELAGISRFHFARSFKRTFGVPPHQYVMRLRMQRACEMLAKTELAITDIALSVGFSSSSEFSRAFRQGLSCTPREYRYKERSASRPAAS